MPFFPSFFASFPPSLYSFLFPDIGRWQICRFIHYWRLWACQPAVVLWPSAAPQWHHRFVSCNKPPTEIWALQKHDYWHTFVRSKIRDDKGILKPAVALLYLYLFVGILHWSKNRCKLVFQTLQALVNIHPQIKIDGWGHKWICVQMIFRISLEYSLSWELNTTWIICIYMPSFLLMKSTDHVVHETANNYKKKMPITTSKIARWCLTMSSTRSPNPKILINHFIWLRYTGNPYILID